MTPLEPDVVERVALKPCPFCGGEAFLSSMAAEPQYVGKAFCQDCGASVIAADLGAAFAAWNTRTAISAGAPVAGKTMVLVPQEPSDAAIRSVDKALHEHWPNARKMAVAVYSAIIDAAISAQSPQLEELRELSENATKGKWTPFESGQTRAIMKGKRPRKNDHLWPEIIAWTGFDGADVPEAEKSANLAFIVACVNYVRAALNSDIGGGS